MADRETNLRATVTLQDQMSPVLETIQKNWKELQDQAAPVLKSLRKEFRAASRDMRDGLSSIGDAAKMAGAGIMAVAGAGAGVWYATTAAAETATQMDMMSKQTGVATERLQAWQAVAVSSGMESEEFAEALRDMNIELSDAATGGKDELAQLLQRVGIAARDASGNIKTADQVFLDFADAVARQKDSAIQLRMAISAFGEDTGAKLLPMLQKGSQAFRDSEAAMKAAGSAISQQQINSLKAFRAEWETIKLQFSAASTSMLSMLAPALSAVAEGIQSVIERIRPLLQEKAGEWADRLAQAVEKIPWDEVADKISALIEGGDRLKEEFGVVGSAVAFAFEHIGEAIALYVTGKTVKGVYDLFDGIMTLGKGFGTLMKTVLPLIGKSNPFILIGSIVISLAATIIRNWDDIKAAATDFVNGVKETFESLFGWLKDIGKGISEAIDAVTPDFMKKRDAKVELQQDVLVNENRKVIEAPKGVDLTNVSMDESDASAFGFESDYEGGLTRDAMAQAIGVPQEVIATEADPQTREVSSSRRIPQTTDFFRTSMTKADTASVSKAAPVQEHKYSGAVVIDFKNAPPNMQLSSVRGEKGLSVDANIEYERQGVGPYAHAF